MRQIYAYCLDKSGKVHKYTDYYIPEDIDINSVTHISLYIKKKDTKYHKDRGYKSAGKMIITKNHMRYVPNFNLDLDIADTSISTIYCLEECDEEALSFFNRKIQNILKEYKLRYEKALAIYGNGITKIEIE